MQNFDKDIKSFESITELTYEALASYSYKSKIYKSLKASLSRIDKKVLFNDIFEAINYSSEINSDLEYRVKSLQSCEVKYSKNLQIGNNIKSTINDLLSFRIVVDDYELEFPDYFRVVDMRNGKKIDDGYRGVHLYFQIDNYHYPIEIQLNTEEDRLFADLAHKHLYKYKSANIGKYMRSLFDKGIIKTEDDFVKELNKHEEINISKAF